MGYIKRSRVRKVKHNKRNTTKKGGAGKKKVPVKEYTVYFSYNGPHITPEAFRVFMREIRMGACTLDKPDKSVMVTFVQSTGPHSFREPDSIIVSCDEKIPHYREIKKGIVALIKNNMFKKNVTEIDSITLHIKNGDTEKDKKVSLL
jgi:hypothetical protein